MPDGRTLNIMRTSRAMIFFSDLTMQTFFEHRAWCCETWGASVELEHIDKHPNCWSWRIDYDAAIFRIYLSTEKEVNWFKLRWL